MLSDLITYSYPMLSAATFAISSVMIKDLTKSAKPSVLNFYRSLVGAIIFLLQLFITGLVHEFLNLSTKTIFILILSVTFNIVLGDTLYFIASKKSGIKIATPIVNLYPISTIILSVAFLDENFNAKFFIGTGLALLGIVFLTSEASENNNEYSRKSISEGVLISFVVVIFYGLGIFFTTLGSLDIDPVVANSIRMPSATILLLINMTVMQKLYPTEPLIKDQDFWIKMIVSGILGTYFSSYFLVLSTKELGAGITSVLTSIGPIFALPLAIFWLREQVGIKSLVGTLTAILGVIIVLT